MSLPITQFKETLANEPSRDRGLQLLEQFADVAHNYANQRSYVAGDLVCVSYLSPYLRYRLISEWEVIAELLKKFPAAKIEKYISEVCWRTYWKGWLETHPRCWKDYSIRVHSWKHTDDPAFLQRLQAAKEGKTELHCFNEWVEELTSTGYLHNSVRMWFASIWIFTLSLPWQLGAAFFQRHLFDGDPASNTLSWRWIAGLHTRGKHYLAQPSTLRKFSDGRYFPDGMLNQGAESLKEASAYETTPISICECSKDAGLPSLSASPAGLLVTPDDLLVEHGQLSEAPFGSIAVLAGHDVSDQLDLAPAVRTFISGAVNDAAKRANHHWQGQLLPVSPTGIPQFQPRASALLVSNPANLRTYVGTVDCWHEAVVNWVLRENLKSVRMYEPPQGAYAAQLPILRRNLSRLGVTFCIYRRKWDNLHWPHADAGYFAFRKNLMQRLADYGLPV
jgi:deoxyribodipyrimidine photo-lyase